MLGDDAVFMQHTQIKYLTFKGSLDFSNEFSRRKIYLVGVKSKSKYDFARIHTRSI